MNEEKKEQSFLDKMKEGFEELKDKAEEVWDKVEDKAEVVWDKVEDTSEKLWDATKETASDLKEKVAHKIDEWQGDAPETADAKPVAPAEPLK